ncbi:F0F1 ATP synthase subunit A [Chryseolinea sp. T2]|uniref:F0F1 ATP synthase subunit A n=1 Tax=Chryseolinea sp. T2 TaxID=3129255 RepID=UPI0030770097
MSIFWSPAKRFSLYLVVFFLTFSGAFAAPQEGHETNTAEEHEAFDPNIIIHHVMDDHVWHLWDHGGTIFLPVIVYSQQGGLDVFSSRNFYDEHHNKVPYNGYVLDEHEHITLNGQSVLDISITKNVAMLLINATLLVLVFAAVAKGYQNNRGKAPKGVQSFMEPIIVFVRDEIVKPNIGKNYEKFMPYMLTLFFFVLFGNLLGLLPGAGNLTGNIAVTLTLAVLTFIITNVKGNKEYWKHIFWTPGVPLPLRIFILPVEIVGIFTKPFSLTVRLFVAITAGHIVLLSLISLTFIFKSIFVGFASSAIVLFISLIELLVAGIQAYVFTLFSSLYIGMATAEHEHEEHH